MWVVVWIGLSIFIGMAGKTKRVGFFGAFFASLLLSPIVGFIIVMLSADEVAAGGTPAATSVKPSAVKGTEQRLSELNALRDKGLVSAEEYEEQRRRILDGV